MPLGGAGISHFHRLICSYCFHCHCTDSHGSEDPKSKKGNSWRADTYSVIETRGPSLSREAREARGEKAETADHKACCMMDLQEGHTQSTWAPQRAYLMGRCSFDLPTWSPSGIKTQPQPVSPFTSLWPPALTDHCPPSPTSWPKVDLHSPAPWSRFPQPFQLLFLPERSQKSKRNIIFTIF